MSESKSEHIGDVLAQALLDHTPRALYLRAVRAEAAYKRAHQQCNDALNKAARMQRERDEAIAERDEQKRRADALERTLQEVHALIPNEIDLDYGGHLRSLELAFDSIEDLCTRAAPTDHPAVGEPAQDGERLNPYTQGYSDGYLEGFERGMRHAPEYWLETAARIAERNGHPVIARAIRQGGDT